MELSIRPVREPDAAAIVAVLEPIVRSGRYTIMTGPVTVADQLAFIRSRPARSIYHVATDDREGRVVGIQDVQPLAAPAHHHVGEISTFVSLGAHRRGIGRRLCDATFAAARRQGYRKLMAVVRADNPGAIAFYRKQGFRTIGTARRHALIGDDCVDEVLTECWLEQT